MVVIEFISQSMVGQWYRCPQQFMRRWIKGEIIPPAIAARRGSGVHKGAAVNHLQKIASGVDLPVEDIQDAARDHYVHLIKEEGVFIPKEQVSEKNQLLANGLDATVRLAKLYRMSLAPCIRPVKAEERLEVDAGLGIPLQGTIDVLTEDMWLPDLKTADKSKAAGEADNSLQLTFYSGLVADCIGEWPKRISLEILVNTKEPKLQSLETTRTANDFAQLMDRIQLMLAQIETGLFPPCDPSSWICSSKWCGYWRMCKYGGKR